MLIIIRTTITLQRLMEYLVKQAGDNKRMANAIRRGTEFIRAGRCVSVGRDAIRISSDSGKTYFTSLTDCVNEDTGERCEAFATGMPCKHRAALHMLRLLDAHEAQGDHKCSECDRRFHLESLVRIDRNELEAGAVVPSGECPVCRSYCYPFVEEDEYTEAA
jgi:hypothetical protein